MEHPDAVPPDAVLRDVARLRALAHSGLDAEPDPEMEYVAAWVRRAVGVPVALVSLVQADQQVFPGMAGLPQPWAGKRATPLSHSFCQHVVTTGEPLVVTDAPADPRVAGNLAIPDLGVAAYAGLPLTDEVGNVLGSLCAIDTVPRVWSAAELEVLGEIAWACSLAVRLRMARHDVERELERRDRVEAAQLRLLDRSQTLLSAAQAFSDTTTVDDVRDRLHELAGTDLRPSFVATVLRDERGRLQRLDDQGDSALAEPFDVHEPVPSAVAIRESRICYYPDRAAFDAAFPAATREIVRRLGLEALVAVPLVGPSDRAGGAVVFGWEYPDALQPADLLTLASVVGYAAQAFDRAGVLGRRVAVAEALQQAMLPTLPHVDGVEMAARYEPADARENVGGDWYDALVVPAPGRPGEHLLTVSVGDITGHALHAATVMGQVRSMLRQTAWDLPGRAPSMILRAFDAANLGTGLAATGTAVIAHLHPPAAGSRGGDWTLEWTAAGHPAPILLLPGGEVEVLGAPDPLFGYRSLLDHPRVDHRCAVPPGAVLFLHTDGLVERRGRDLADGLAALVALLRGLHDRPVAEIVDTAVATLACDARDDVVAFAIRLPA